MVRKEVTRFRFITEHRLEGTFDQRAGAQQSWSGLRLASGEAVWSHREAPGRPWAWGAEARAGPRGTAAHRPFWSLLEGQQPGDMNPHTPGQP